MLHSVQQLVINFPSLILKDLWRNVNRFLKTLLMHKCTWRQFLLAVIILFIERSLPIVLPLIEMGDKIQSPHSGHDPKVYWKLIWEFSRLVKFPLFVTVTPLHLNKELLNRQFYTKRLETLKDIHLNWWTPTIKESYNLHLIWPIIFQPGFLESAGRWMLLWKHGDGAGGGLLFKPSIFYVFVLRSMKTLHSVFLCS